VGVGKTSLIKSFLSKIKDKDVSRGVYVSLYGKDQLSQIDEDIFQQLHPILGSKGVRLLGTIAKGLIKTTTKIDFDKNESVSIAAGLPNVKLSELFPSPSDCVIVFDDLERCSLDITVLMDCINSFIEHEGVKIIVVADESQLRKENINKYKTIKEKSIGKTLEVRSVEVSAVETFIEAINDKRSKE
jgi:GTPase SAR1 family protein